MPDLDAAFVDIGIGRSGFLRAEDRAGIDDWPPPGAPLLVQVRTDDEGARKGRACRWIVAVSAAISSIIRLGTGVSLLAPHRGRVRARALARPCRGDCSKAASCCAPRRRARRRTCCRPMRRRSWSAGRASAGRPSSVQPPADLSARIPGERDPIARALRDHGATLDEVILDDRMHGARAAGRDGPPRRADPRALAFRPDAGLRHRRCGGPDRHGAGRPHRARKRRRGAVRAGRDAVRPSTSTAATPAAARAARRAGRSTSTSRPRRRSPSSSACATSRAPW